AVIDAPTGEDWVAGGEGEVMAEGLEEEALHPRQRSRHEDILANSPPERVGEVRERGIVGLLDEVVPVGDLWFLDEPAQVPPRRPRNQRAHEFLSGVGVIDDDLPAG